MHVRRIVASALAGLTLTLVGTASAHEKGEKKEANIERVRRDPHGRVTGVILDDGTELVGEVKNRQKLERIAISGDPVRVTVDADERLVLVNGRTFETVTIGDRDRTVVRPLIHNPLGIGGVPIWAVDHAAARLDDATTLGRFFVYGRVALVLKTDVGRPSGLLMDDGTQVHIVPRFSGALDGIEPGTQLRVEGLGTRDPQGLAMWALSIKERDYVHLDVERGEGAPEINIEGPFTEAESP